jgi:hypothetical protein
VARLTTFSTTMRLELLRDWWRIARPQVWLFPGLDPINPMSTRQLNRACHAAAQMAEKQAHDAARRAGQGRQGSSRDALATVCQQVFTASAITDCSQAASAPTTSPTRASCSPRRSHANRTSTLFGNAEESLHQFDLFRAIPCRNGFISLFEDKYSLLCRIGKMFPSR